MPTPRSLFVLLVPLAMTAACRRSRSAPPRAETQDASLAGQPTAVATPPLLAEHFDGARALEAWQEVDGRVDGNGATSMITFEDGAVRLEGAADTNRWRSLERTVALGGATWFRMAARMKTDGLVVDGVHRPMCYVYARFTDAAGKRVGEVVATRNLLGTTPWTAVARRYPVPAGAANLTVGLFLSLLAAGQNVSLPGLGRFMAMQSRRVPCVLTGQQGVRRYPTFRPSSSFKGAVVRGERHLAVLKKRRERREAAAPVHGGNIPTVPGVHEFRDPVMILGDLQELGATDVDPADELPRDADLQLLAAPLEREVNHGSTRTDWSGGSGAGAPGA